MSPIRIKHLDHVVLRVADLERSIGFWCGVLGCREEKRNEQLGIWQLRCGGSMIDLVPLDGDLGKRDGYGPPQAGRNMDHVCLRIEHYDEAALRTYLTAHGVEPGPTVRRYGAEGDGPSMYIRDPDGNNVELKGPPDGK